MSSDGLIHAAEPIRKTFSVGLQPVLGQTAVIGLVSVVNLHVFVAEVFEFLRKDLSSVGYGGPLNILAALPPRAPAGDRILAASVSPPLEMREDLCPLSL